MSRRDWRAPTTRCPVGPRTETPHVRFAVPRGFHRHFILRSSGPASFTSLDATMKRSSALFLQVVVVLIGIATLAFMLWEPHVEGRNAHATTFEIYFNDPFLAYVYVGSTPFFVALYRAYRLLGHVRRTGAFSQVTLDALHAIKRSALVLIGFVAGAAVLILVFGDGEDRPPGVFMSFLALLVSSSIATGAALFARTLQNRLRRS